MARRNFLMDEYWKNKITDWEPELAFKGKTKEDWTIW